MGMIDSLQPESPQERIARRIFSLEEGIRSHRAATKFTPLSHSYLFLPGRIPHSHSLLRLGVHYILFTQVGKYALVVSVLETASR